MEEEETAWSFSLASASKHAFLWVAVFGINVRVFSVVLLFVVVRMWMEKEDVGWGMQRDEWKEEREKELKKHQINWEVSFHIGAFR